MTWSKLKKQVEALLAESVKDHLQFYMTRYGPGDSYTMARAWVTWDRVELINMSNVEWLMARYSLKYSGETMPEMVLRQRGVYSRDDFYEALIEYVNLPFEAALQSANDIIMAWAMFDRRLGKRRLRRMSPGDVARPLVRQFYHLRCQAENIPEGTHREGWRSFQPSPRGDDLRGYCQAMPWLPQVW
jgi:hypothetical protein